MENHLRSPRRRLGVATTAQLKDRDTEGRDRWRSETLDVLRRVSLQQTAPWPSPTVGNVLFTETPIVTLAHFSTEDTVA